MCRWLIVWLLIGFLLAFLLAVLFQSVGSLFIFNSCHRAVHPLISKSRHPQAVQLARILDHNLADEEQLTVPTSLDDGRSFKYDLNVRNIAARD